MIRQVTADDIPSLAKLTRTTRLATYGPLLSPSQQEAFYAANTLDAVEVMIRQKIQQPGYHTYIYEQTGQIKGYIVANPYAGTIPFLFVRQGQHGKGVGSALVDYLMEEHDARTYRVVLLETNVRARVFYESKGFTISGSKDRSYFGVRRIIMVRHQRVGKTTTPRSRTSGECKHNCIDISNKLMYNNTQ